MSIWQWEKLLDAPPPDYRVTLGEGRTPLVGSRRIGQAHDLRRLSFKLESSNPSGSYKDRFAASAISHMLAAGQSHCIATSSGNTGAALAAYCAAAGIDCRIAIVETAPSAKLQQMFCYGAHLMRVEGFGIDPTTTSRTFEWLSEAAAHPQAALQISAFKYSPLGMSGVQTIAFEIAEQAPDVDNVFIPVGGGGLALAVALGFEQLRRANLVARVPRLHCVQPIGNDTIASALRRGDEKAVPVAGRSSITGLQVPSVIDGDQLIAHCRATGGTGYLVDDESVYHAQKRLAREEGIFCEPAAAVSVAGALSARERQEIGPEESTICLITGSGFKDQSAIERMNADLECPRSDLAGLADFLNPRRTPATSTYPSLVG